MVVGGLGFDVFLVTIMEDLGAGTKIVGKIWVVCIVWMSVKLGRMPGCLKMGGG